MTTSADPDSVDGQVKMRLSFTASSPTTMLPSPAPGEFAVVLEMGQPYGQLGYARVGPLVRAAKLRGRYRNPANAPLFFTAVFNVAVVGSLGTYSVWDQMPWTVVFFTCTVYCWALGFWRLWSRREQTGEQFKVTGVGG